MTNEQRTALYGMLKLWILKYGLETSDVIGHYEVNKNKTCPNLDMNSIRAELSAQFGGLH